MRQKKLESLCKYVDFAKAIKNMFEREKKNPWNPYARAPHILEHICATLKYQRCEGEPSKHLIKSFICCPYALSLISVVSLVAYSGITRREYYTCIRENWMSTRSVEILPKVKTQQLHTSFKRFCNYFKEPGSFTYPKTWETKPKRQRKYLFCL